jgi:hypothetical protein
LIIAASKDVVGRMRKVIAFIATPLATALIAIQKRMRARLASLVFEISNSNIFHVSTLELSF